MPTPQFNDNHIMADRGDDIVSFTGAKFFMIRAHPAELSCNAAASATFCSLIKKGSEMYL